MSFGTPEELEKLMWSVAESGDHTAIEEFGERFPHLRGELGKRMEMVRQLRGAAKVSGFSRDIPKFENRPIRPTPIQPGAWIGGGVVLLAVAGAAFAVTRSLSRPAPVPEPVPVVQTAPPELPKPQIEYKSQPPVAESTPQPPASDAIDAPSRDPAQAPQTVKFEHVRLATAIKAVAASGGLELEIAPNLNDTYVQIDYQGYSALQILQDMGRRFGFTAFDDGPHRVLIIPARDPRAPTQPTIPVGDEQLPEKTGVTDQLPLPASQDPGSKRLSGPVGNGSQTPAPPKSGTGDSKDQVKGDTGKTKTTSKGAEITPGVPKTPSAARENAAG